MLKPLNSFFAKTGVKTKFDSGDIITNGIDRIIIFGITSMSDGAYYTGVYENWKHFMEHYHKTNKDFEMYKPHNDKIQYYISNGGNSDGDIFEIAIGEKEYPIWFEKEWKRIK